MSSPTEENKKNYTVNDLGEMVGHNGWVTSIKSTVDSKVVLSSSRDKSIIIWQVLEDGEEAYAKPFRRLYGHEHFVEDLQVSSDGRYALSGSWDKTMRLWNLETGESVTRFVGHTNDVMAVSFSADNRQILSGSRDRTLRLWNTVGEHHYTIEDKINPEWITCAAFSPKENPPAEEENAEGQGKPSAPSSAEEPRANPPADNAPNTADSIGGSVVNPGAVVDGEKRAAPNFDFLLYGSFNGTIKKFNFASRVVEYIFERHSAPVTALSISPDASLCASGSKDGAVFLWEVNNGKEMREKSLEGAVAALKFNPKKYWLCAVTDREMKVWDLYKRTVVAHEKFPENTSCTSVEWGVDSATLLFGFANGKIRAMKIVEANDYEHGIDDGSEDLSEEGERQTDYSE